MDEIEIPNYLDDRLFIMWEMEEALTFLACFLFVTQMSNIIIGGVAGYVGFRAMRAFKARQPRGAIRHWLYWHGILPFQKTAWFSGLEREVFGS